MFSPSMSSMTHLGSLCQAKLPGIFQPTSIGRADPRLAALERLLACAFSGTCKTVENRRLDGCQIGQIVRFERFRHEHETLGRPLVHLELVLQELPEVAVSDESLAHGEDSPTNERDV